MFNCRFSQTQSQFYLHSNMFTNLTTAQFWDTRTHPLVEGNLFFSGSPMYLLALLLITGILMRRWSAKSHQSSDTSKPILLVANGMIFGIHGVILSALIFIVDIKDSLSCVPPAIPMFNLRSYQFLVAEILLHGAILWLLMRVVLIFEGLLLNSATGRLKVSPLRLTNDLFLVAFIYTTTRFMPGGPSLFHMFTNLSFYTYIYGYHTLKAGLMTDRWLEHLAKKFFIVMRLVWSVSLLWHYFYMITCTHDSKLHIIGTFEGLYGAGMFVTAMAKLRKMLAMSSKKSVKFTNPKLTQ